MKEEKKEGKEKREDLNLGGMAVIEGVMIKGKHHAVVTVRREGGDLKINRKDLAGQTRPPWTWPVFRGLVVFWQTLSLGFWALDFSAAEATGEEKTAPWMMAVTGTVAFLLGGVLFFYLPLLLTQLARNHLAPFLANDLAFNFIDGLIRIAVFILYILAIGTLPDIRRIFEYHGAEHKTVTAYEGGGSFDMESARACSTLHRRCGTAFLLTVMVISIVFFSLISSDLPFTLKLAWRLILLPLIAGASFEVIRLTEKPWGRKLAWLTVPGLWLQKLTTREPDDSQLEVAATAVKEILRLEGRLDD